jgi:hypothetical protein
MTRRVASNPRPGEIRCHWNEESLVSGVVECRIYFGTRPCQACPELVRCILTNRKGNGTVTPRAQASLSGAAAPPPPSTVDAQSLVYGFLNTHLGNIWESSPQQRLQECFCRDRISGFRSETFSPILHLAMNLGGQDQTRQYIRKHLVVHGIILISILATPIRKQYFLNGLRHPFCRTTFIHTSTNQPLNNHSKCTNTSSSPLPRLSHTVCHKQPSRKRPPANLLQAELHLPQLLKTTPL